MSFFSLSSDDRVLMKQCFIFKSCDNLRSVVYCELLSILSSFVKIVIIGIFNFDGIFNF